MALDPPAPVGEPTAGDWDSVPFTRTPDQTQQYVTKVLSWYNHYRAQGSATVAQR